MILDSAYLFFNDKGGTLLYSRNFEGEMCVTKTHLVFEAGLNTLDHVLNVRANGSIGTRTLINQILK